MENWPLAICLPLQTMAKICDFERKIQPFSPLPKCKLQVNTKPNSVKVLSHQRQVRKVCHFGGERECEAFQTTGGPVYVNWPKTGFEIIVQIYIVILMENAMIVEHLLYNDTPILSVQLFCKAVFSTKSALRYTSTNSVRCCLFYKSWTFLNMEQY